MLRKEDIIGSWLLVARGHENSQDDQMLRDRYGDNPLGGKLFLPFWAHF